MMAARKPIGEIQYDPREEPGLGHTQESTAAKLVDPVTKAVAPAKRPQAIMMRAIHSRAPTFSMIRLLGISKMK